MRLKAIHAAGIYSLRELLYIRPIRYQDHRELIPLSAAREGQGCCLRLRRSGEPATSYHGSLNRVTCLFCDDTGEISVCWFNQPWMSAQCARMEEVTFFGTVKRFGKTLQLLNPVLVKQAEIQPVYRPMEGLTQKTHRSIVLQALSMAEELCPETLPESVLEQYSLLPCVRALRFLHAPSSMEEVAQAQRRFSFEQMLLYQVSVQEAKFHRGSSYAMEIAPDTEEKYWSGLPFSPTAAQRRSLHEIALDMAKQTAMARMVQGDVGSGKTAVAMGAMLLCMRSGYQAVLMAPTEILAQQHYRELSAFFSKEGFTCGLLTGSLSAKEKRAALAALRDGAWQAAVGTHALISEGTGYARLGLCVTDEQHRFGVNQRESLLQKGLSVTGVSPHLLVMSATPIPRSLALVLYGDLDLSVIDELPPGRQPVGTRIVPREKREDMYSFIRENLSRGQQAYFVCPLVESDEDSDSLKDVKSYAKSLQDEVFPEYRVGISYGSQTARDKAETLHAFAAGEIHVLVATTVIEVGVNVPNASIMVIENADRFGLAQLHQLRGRVGRGSEKSWCFLLAPPNERLRTLCRTNDGFQVAQDDLEQRGPGELFGTLQSGTDVWLAGISGDSRLLYEATECARRILSDPERESEAKMLRKEAEQRIGRLCGQISIS